MASSQDFEAQRSITPLTVLTTVDTVSDSIMKLDGKKALVFGVASEDSIAYAICQRLAQAGCSLVLGFQPRFRSRIQQLSATLPEGTELHPIDVNVEGSTASFFLFPIMAEQFPRGQSRYYHPFNRVCSEGGIRQEPPLRGY